MRLHRRSDTYDILRAALKMATKTLAMSPYVHRSSRTRLLLRQALPSFLRNPTTRFDSLSTISISSGNTRSSRAEVPIKTDYVSGSGFGLVRHRKFTTGATHVNEAGSIDSLLMQSMEKKIKEELNAESVTVIDAYGDGRHVTIDVVSTAFEGKSDVDRQRMVYKAIQEELENVVNAVDQMTTTTPSEAATGK
ncbi:BolA-like family protein [Tripterygium wilfordii]|uniref:BolA-like family protein n=1 Tax=Tripterygium wilfordii TaxID=458696 RepID=A0A7J7CMG5_TRIWF|nr:protein BOLA4, chloroplastic/mitochondrial-like [Tripterygium wilfordii]KAF5735287.1 BolA-like family protein [Tripterygium wilfordii]